MFERFTRDARAVVVSTQDLCRELGADEARPVPILLALTQEGSGAHAHLAAHGITTDAVAKSLGILPPAPRAPLGEDDAAALQALGIDPNAVRADIDDPRRRAA